ncbi:NAD-dependent protein deacetylase [Aquisalimonas sp.]|uniref:NAD-dependent protein deacetylase n=1 Tax=Aquisalimonas sp. TaxID=1872621 RepID=UPI0025C29090|nr:NAD-dependent protein deacetylase [Aquisalimonas sp.]
MPATSMTAGEPAELHRLVAMLDASRRPLVLTGAGLSTESGIPDYRDIHGGWKRKPPIQLREFQRSAHARRRYWARSMAGWSLMRQAQPNSGHEALARLERAGHLHWLITQNVDGLHQRAGSRTVTDLHGRLDVVACLDCGHRLSRDALQATLTDWNSGWDVEPEQLAPDGDVDLESSAFETFRVPDCPSCGGLLKPEVVFFGEKVPPERVETAFTRLDEADLLLVVGSSLMVWSGYRFVRHAAARDIPVAVLNLGETRGDREAAIKVEASCGDALARIVDALEA